MQPGFSTYIMNISHEIYPLHRCVSVQCSIIIYRHSVIWPISRTYPSCITVVLYPLVSLSPFPLPPVPGNHHSILCFYKGHYFRDLI